MAELHFFESLFDDDVDDEDKSCGELWSLSTCLESRLGFNFSSSAGLSDSANFSGGVAWLLPRSTDNFSTAFIGAEKVGIGIKSTGWYLPTYDWIYTYILIYTWRWLVSTQS